MALINAAAKIASVDEFGTELAQLTDQVADDPPRDAARATGAGMRETQHDHDTSHHHFASLGIEFPPVVSRAELSKLITSIAPHLQRAKGVACFSEEPDRQYVWNYLGGDKELTYDRLPGVGFRPVAVFIGAGLPHDEIRERVSALTRR